MSESQRVVVGVDGSSASEAAIRWAVDEARVRQVPLHVVHTYGWPQSPADRHSFSATSGLDLASLKQTAARILELSIAHVNAIAGD